MLLIQSKLLNNKLQPLLQTTVTIMIQLLQTIITIVVLPLQIIMMQLQLIIIIMLPALPKPLTQLTPVPHISLSIMMESELYIPDH